MDTLTCVGIVVLVCIAVGCLGMVLDGIGES